MMRYQEKVNISFPSSFFAFSFFIYVHCGCSTIEDNNVIVVLQRQFISHLDRIKSTKHNTVFIVYSLLLLMRKEGAKIRFVIQITLVGCSCNFFCNGRKIRMNKMKRPLLFHCIHNCFH